VRERGEDQDEGGAVEGELKDETKDEQKDDTAKKAIWDIWDVVDVP
jgi:hypothetical protein